MNRRPVDMHKPAAAEAADRRQAEYYHCLLAELRAEVDRTIVNHLTAMAEHESRGKAGPRDLGHLVRRAERERQAIDCMIDALDRRFPSAGLATPPRTQSPPDEIVHPDGRSLLSITQTRRSTNGAGRRSDKKVG